MSLSPIYLSAFHLSPNVTGIVYATSNLKHSLQLEIWPLFLIHPFFYFHPPPKFHVMYDHIHVSHFVSEPAHEPHANAFYLYGHCVWSTI